MIDVLGCLTEAEPSGNGCVAESLLFAHAVSEGLLPSLPFLGRVPRQQVLYRSQLVGQGEIRFMKSLTGIEAHTERGTRA
jgi:hypothetical protein